MRILHTSDWHLGRSFGEHDLLDQQQIFVDWLVEEVSARSIELVVVAGDLFDRSVPSGDAMDVFSDSIRRLRDTGAEVALIAGNHDSAQRIAAFDGLVDPGIVIHGGYGSASSVVVRHFPDGPLAIVATPFLEPLTAPADMRAEILSARSDDAGDGEGRSPRLSHEAVLAHALDRAREELAAVGPMRSIVLAHAFVTGAAPSDSERELAVGHSGMVSVDLFDGFDYVALGHLHRPQTVAGRTHVRYSGSPLPYSFGETTPKQVAVVELDAAGGVSVEEVAVPVGRGVRVVRGSFEDLTRGDIDAAHWIRVELTDHTVIADARRVLRTRFPWLVELEQGGRAGRVGSSPSVAELRRRSPSALAQDFWNDVVTEHPDAEVVHVLDAAVERARHRSSA